MSAKKSGRPSKDIMELLKEANEENRAAMNVAPAERKAEMDSTKIVDDGNNKKRTKVTKRINAETAELIDKEVKELIQMIHDRTLKILTDNKEGFLALATVLLEKEVIFAEDLENIFGPRVGAKKEETPEVKELANLLDISAKDVVDILEIFMYCDPFIDNLDSLIDPMLPPCHDVWQRFADEDLDKLAALAQQLKEYF
jgi:hypothetical protein